jgi:Leucine-rich repeat (LRR) protein
MGCNFGKKKTTIEDENDNNIPLDNQIPKDEFLCPKCGKLVPEILNLFIDNKKIDFKCKRCTKINEKSEIYLSKMAKKYSNYLKTKCKYCDNKSKDNEDIFLYCYDCQIDFCSRCKEKHQRETNNEHSQIISVNEKKNKCLNHFNEDINSFCFDCGENICEKQKDKHYKHNISKINDLEGEFLKSIVIIKQKNKELLNIIKFNKAIMNAFDNNVNNYFYLKSLKNIAVALEKEKKRDSNDLIFLLNDFQNELKSSEEAKNKFVKEKSITIDRQEECLLLSENELKDENTKCLSLIKFNHLKEINLSENEIKNIDFLFNMNLPFLELLNLSNNQIENIDVLGKINSKKLKYLFIQNNQIKDIKVFNDNYKSNFILLEILRLENNKFEKNSNLYNEIKMKYGDIIISDEFVEKIKREFRIIYDNENGTIAVKNTGESSSILRNIFIIISENNKNTIRKLDLSNNKIVDPSLLNRIQFDFLNELILSNNIIKNLNFLKGMKAKNLKRLYLNDNLINDLSPLNNSENIEKIFPKLEYISLINNNFDYREPKNQEILQSYGDRLEPFS